MLTKEEIKSCCDNLRGRFAALEQTRHNIAAAFDKAVGRRLSALVGSGLNKYNCPNRRVQADAHFFDIPAMKEAGCGCYFGEDGNGRIYLAFHPSTNSGNLASERFLTITARPEGAEPYAPLKENFDAIHITMGWHGGDGGSAITFPLRDNTLTFLPSILFPDSLCHGRNDIPLEDFIREPKDVAALARANAVLEDYEIRLRRLARLMEAASEILTAMEAKWGAVENSRDDEIRQLFGLKQDAAAPRATVYRVQLTAEPAAEQADGKEG